MHSAPARRAWALRSAPTVPDDPATLNDGSHESDVSIASALSRFRERISLSLHTTAVLCILLIVACGFGGPAPAPTLVLPPTPAPRPTAEPPAAVSTWYQAAQAEE